MTKETQDGFILILFVIMDLAIWFKQLTLLKKHTEKTQTTKHTRYFYKTSSNTDTHIPITREGTTQEFLDLESYAVAVLFCIAFAETRISVFSADTKILVLTNGKTECQDFLLFFMLSQ